jgi:hypothetical protein
MTENATAVSTCKSLYEQEALEKCISFLNSIGIKTIKQKLPPGCFLPGLSIQEGCIIIDMEALKFPGDILHEAGHIAIIPSAERAALNEFTIGKRENHQAEEMMAIAWSYAACVHIGLDPYFVFHDKGYKGGGSYIADNFRDKQYFGLPMLQWKGMAADQKNAVILNVEPYPKMIKWMLD